jgi:ribosomal protein S26
MLASLTDLLFGCGHRNYSFPRTVRHGARSPAAAVTGTYVVCLNCGREFPYDWKAMKVISIPSRVSRIVEPAGIVRGEVS